jgi:hypothetical protein
MNQYLKSAVDRYEKFISKYKEPLKIHPISVIDAEIIIELQQILKKCNMDTVVNILGQYKFLKDEEIRDKLLQFNIDFNKLQEIDISEDQDIEIFDFITLKNKLFKLKYIFSYEKIEQWDHDRGDLKYGIHINKTDEKVSEKMPLYGNEKVWYFSYSNRDKEFDELDDYFKHDIRNNFIN